jgi:hypothetical protein
MSNLIRIESNISSLKSKTNEIDYCYIRYIWQLTIKYENINQYQMFVKIPTYHLINFTQEKNNKNKRLAHRKKIINLKCL